MIFKKRCTFIYIQGKKKIKKCARKIKKDIVEKQRKEKVGFFLNLFLRNVEVSFVFFFAF